MTRPQSAIDPTAPYAEFARRLRAAREKCGRSVDYCAAAIAVSAKAWLRYESGERFPRTPEGLRAVAAAVKTTVGRLVD